MHLVQCNHLYIEWNSYFPHLYQDQPNLETIQLKYLPLIIFYFHPNVGFVFLYWLFHCNFLRSISSTLYYSWCIIRETIFYSLSTFHWSNSTVMINMKRQLFYCGHAKVFMKDINNFLANNKTFIHHNSYSLVFIKYVST